MGEPQKCCCRWDTMHCRICHDHAGTPMPEVDWLDREMYERAMADAAMEPVAAVRCRELLRAALRAPAETDRP